MTRQKPKWLKQVILLVGLVAVLGWVGAGAVQAQDHSSVLQESGFKKWNVDTDNEKAFFDKHPGNKFITYKQADNVVHVYKDPETGVVYVGDEDALQAYLNKTEAQGMSAKAREDAAEADDPDFWLNWEDEYGP